MSDQDFASLKRVAAESRLGRVIASEAQRLSDAWRDSLAGGLFRRGAREILAWPVRERVRVGALLAGWGAIGHWGLLFLVPPYVAPGVPPVIFLVIGVVAFGMAAAARQVSEGWPHSAIGRVTTWLVS